MSESEITYDLNLLRQSRGKWHGSPALRAVYENIFRDMAARRIDGPSLELGSGIGVAAETIPELVTSDVVKTEYVERAVSAYEIPPENWANLMAMDTLHHLQRPMEFFASAAAALRPGGRIILMEPAGTWWGRIFYRWFHHEPCIPVEIIPPFEFPADDNGEFANMGMGEGLLTRERREFEARLAPLGLKVVAVDYRDFLAYPATGGFSNRAILPAGCLKVLMAMEQIVPQFLIRFFALRMVIVVERDSTAESTPE
ncbi:class I SAM-dependent methyltransferase [Opitutaceae bacterium]|nr:class I SAM-dependent methyltransferase [Opitutaceae bacterium]